jgi:hypothetical protein
LELKPAICPFCGGDLRLPEDKKVLKCMYCGKDIIVHDAIEKAVGPSTENLLVLAKSAQDAGNNKEAYDYFNRVLELNPTNYEAWFGKGASAGWLSTLADFRLPEMITGIETAIKFCSDDQKEQLKIKGAEVLNKVSVAYFQLSSEHMHEYGRLGNVSNEFYNQCASITTAMELAHAYAPCDRQIIDNIIFILQQQIEGTEYKDFNDYGEIKGISRVTPQYEETLRSKMVTFVQKRQELDPAYQAPTVKKKSACFIVTATLGDVNHPNVLLLQKFRDEWLSKRALGRVFIGKYYNYSPRVAQAIRHRSKLAKVLNFIIVKPSARIATCLLRRRQEGS